MPKSVEHGLELKMELVVTDTLGAWYGCQWLHAPRPELQGNAYDAIEAGAEGFGRVLIALGQDMLDPVVRDEVERCDVLEQLGIEREEYYVKAKASEEGLRKVLQELLASPFESVRCSAFAVIGRRRS